MADIFTHLGDIIFTADVHKIGDMIERLKDGDELIISLEANDAHQADSILAFLDRNGMDYHAEGSHDGKEYRIIARRKLH
ncbi:hypothetical protein GJ688_08235 [Heliobacillus mobilis]|uniref:Uncharacterized protein n=2 Tax=Heliobacterium TaxID=2697 RepID=A0A6I3SJA6_HELMO|nr:MULTISPECIES: hypothetical protein [Heliobacterium]MBC9783686.1 hypothetical protein [Heliobacterium chlorum]MTV48968.1 hypothetical protein [Heliobacterium mobile]